MLGFVCYAVGARDSVAIAAVLGSQFAAVASVAADVLFRERLTRLQLAGAVVIVVGVAALTAVTVELVRGARYRRVGAAIILQPKSLVRDGLRWAALGSRPLIFAANGYISCD